MVHIVYIPNGFYRVDFKCFVPLKAATKYIIQKVKKVRRSTSMSPPEGKIQKILPNYYYGARKNEFLWSDWGITADCGVTV